jgi:sarcosine oxidase subunit gamma
MSERQHALDAFLRDAVTGEKSSVIVEVNPGLDYINLRGNPTDRKFVSATNKVLRVDLPLQPNTFTAGLSTAYWLGPDEWLIASPAGERPTLRTLLDDALNGMHASLNVVSGGYVALRVSGMTAALLLSKGCTLDFHPRSFAAGQCAQSGLAKASVLISMIDDKPTFDIIVRRSFAEYLALWLRRAGAEFGVSFVYR